MSPERHAACVTMLKTVQVDIEKDVIDMDGQSLAAAAGEAIGHLAAQVHAVAAVLLAVLEDGAKE